MKWPAKFNFFRNKKLLLLISVVICFGAAGYFYLGAGRPDNAVAQEIKEVTVKRGDLKIDLAADGTAELSTVALNFQISGLVKEIPVRVGDRVKDGAIIARLDAGKYELDLQAARAGYQAAQAKLAKAREDYNNKLLAAKEKLDNLMLEYQPMSQAPDIFARQELELKKLAVENAQAAHEYARAGTSDIKVEEAGVAQALAALKKAERNLEDTVLKTPVSGTVLYIGGKVGESVSVSGDNADKQFAVVADSNDMEVTAQVLELDIAEISAGQEAEVEFEAIPDVIFPGKVTAVDPQPVTDSSGIVAYEVSVALAKPDVRIKNGMTGAVSFIVKQKKDVLIIPNAAVKRADGAQLVEKVGPSGEILTQKVKTGFTDGTSVEVMEGLRQGDKIVIRKNSPVKG